MRTCRVCKEEKPLMEFYQQTNGNLFTECKACACARVRANRLVKLDYYQAKDRERGNLPHRVEARAEYAKTPEGKERIREGARRWQRRNPVKRRAQHIAGNAIRDGKLIRQPCEVCGKEKAQAHHDDYSKPLEVRWLCTTHHAEWHKHNTPLCPDQSTEAA